jgi:O-antigen/teichoic acid export membrane protein
MSMNQIYQGTLIRSGLAIHVLLARVIRFGAGLLVLLVGLKTSWVSGAVLGAIAITFSLLLQTIYLWWKSRICTTRLKENPLETEVVKTSALIKFTIPLSITPILGSITGLVMAAAIGRLPGVVVSLAIWPVVTNFNNIGLGMGQSYDQVTVKHYASQEDRKRLMKFGIILGILLSIITALFIVSGIFHYVLRSLENLDETNSKISINAMWFLAAMPFLYTMISYYSGLLAKSMKTVPIMISQTFSLLIVMLMLLATINLEPFLGVYVVSAASVIAAGVSLLWLWHSWRKIIPGLPAAT